MMVLSPFVRLLIVLLAFGVTANFGCRESEACAAPAVTHNEVMN